MSDDFIPLNQSTPTCGGRSQGRGRNNRSFQQQRYHQNLNQQNGPRRHYQNRRGNNSQNRNSSFGSDSNSSFSQDKTNIDAYIHPAMLQDPWAQLRKQQDDAK